jgi:hypothetical protein
VDSGWDQGKATYVLCGNRILWYAPTVAEAIAQLEYCQHKLSFGGAALFEASP